MSGNQPPDTKDGAEAIWRFRGCSGSDCVFLLVLRFLDFGPCITQGYGPIEYELAGGAVGVNAEVA